MNSRIYVSNIIVCQKKFWFFTFYINSKITFVGKKSKGLREILLFKKVLKCKSYHERNKLCSFINYYLKELDWIKVQKK